MACDLAIVMGDPVAVLRYVTVLADSLTKSGADASAEATVATRTADTAGATDNALTELVAAEFVAAVVPVADSIWVAGRKSVMDYSMAGMQLAKIKEDWRTVLQCLELAARVHPDEPAVVEGIAEARMALNDIDNDK